MLINSTVADAARKRSVSEATIAGILDRWIACTVDWGAWARLGVIGIDEIALKRGHRDVVVLVTVPLRRSGSGASGSSPARRRSRQPTPCGKT